MFLTCCCRALDWVVLAATERCSTRWVVVCASELLQKLSNLCFACWSLTYKGFIVAVMGPNNIFFAIEEKVTLVCGFPMHSKSCSASLIASSRYNSLIQIKEVIRTSEFHIGNRTMWSPIWELSKLHEYLLIPNSTRRSCDFSFTINLLDKNKLRKDSCRYEMLSVMRISLT